MPMLIISLYCSSGLEINRTSGKCAILRGVTRKQNNSIALFNQRSWRNIEVLRHKRYHDLGNIPKTCSVKSGTVVLRAEDRNSGNLPGQRRLQVNVAWAYRATSD